MNDVVLTLASDGKNIKGKMEYLRSKAVFYLVGEVKKSKLILQEYDSEGLITGYLKGEYVESGIRGQWQNVDNNLGSDLKLEEVKNRVEVPSYCGNKFNVYYTKTNGKEFTCTFHADINLPVGCQEYADYATSYDVLYPKTRNEAFNQWIEKIMLTWNGKSKKYMNEIVTMRQTPVPSMRQMLRAHAWTDIDVYNSDVISGQIHFSSSWTKNPTSQNLNFNLKSGKEILAKDIFRLYNKQKHDRRANSQ